MIDALDIGTRDILSKVVSRTRVLVEPVPRRSAKRKRGGGAPDGSRSSIVEAIETDARRAKASLQSALRALDAQTKTLERCPESCKRILDRHLADIKSRKEELSTWRPREDDITAAMLDATPSILFEFEAENVERDPKEFFGQGQLVSAWSAVDGMSYEDAGHYRVVAREDERLQTSGGDTGLPSGEAMLRIVLTRLDMLRAVPKATQKRMVSLAEYATPAGDAFGSLEKTLRELAKRQGQIMEQVRRRGLKYKTYEEFAKQYEQAQRTLYVKRYMAGVYASFFAMMDSFLQHAGKEGRLWDLPAVSNACSGSGKSLEKVVTCMVTDVLLNNKATNNDKEIESAVTAALEKIRSAMTRSFFRKVAEFEALSLDATKDNSMDLASKHGLPRASRSLDVKDRIVILKSDYSYRAIKAPTWVLVRSQAIRSSPYAYFSGSRLSASRTEQDVADVIAVAGKVQGVQSLSRDSDKSESSSRKDFSKFAEDFDAALEAVIRRDDEGAWGKLHDDVQQRLAKLQGSVQWLSGWVAALKNDDADSRQASKAVSLKAFLSFWMPSAMTALVRGRPVARMDPDLAQRLSNQTDKYKQVLMAIGSMARSGRVVFEILDRQYKKSVAALHVIALCLELLHKDDANRRLSVELAAAMVDVLSWYAKFNDYKDGEWKDTLARQNEAIKERKIRLEQNLNDEDKAALQEFKKVRKEKYDGSVERMLEGLQTIEDDEEELEESKESMDDDAAVAQVPGDLEAEEEDDENDNDEEDVDEIDD